MFPATLLVFFNLLIFIHYSDKVSKVNNRLRAFILFTASNDEYSLGHIKHKVTQIEMSKLKKFFLPHMLVEIAFKVRE